MPTQPATDLGVAREEEHFAGIFELEIPEREDSYNGILYQPLMDRLKTLCKGRVIVSADVNHLPENFTKKRPAELSAEEWKRFKENLDVQPHYIEYTIH